MTTPMETPTAPGPTGGGIDDFEALLMPLMTAAYATAHRLTRNAADAEDLVQEAVLLACRGFGSFARGTNFRAWFFRILTNAYFSKYRQQRRRGTTVELEDTPELYLYVQTASTGLHARVADPAEALMDRLDGALVAEALDRLPEDFRVVAVLYFINDMAYDEIATSLNLPIGTVRSRLHRARRMLQRGLWAIAEDRGIVTQLAAESP